MARERRPQGPDGQPLEAARQGGRPRSERSEQAILHATRDLLAEIGVRGLTVEAVAARAGVAKTTVYRRWRSKEDLALSVLIDMAQRMMPVPDLGDTRRELVALVRPPSRCSARRSWDG